MPHGFYTIRLLQEDEHFAGPLRNYRKPHIEIGNAVVAEGDSGEKTVEVEVHVKKSFGSTITIDYHTDADGSAIAVNLDYVPISNGQLVIGPHNTPLEGKDACGARWPCRRERWSTRADIVFLFDTTPKMGGSINDVQTNSPLMDAAMQAAGINAQYAGRDRGTRGWEAIMTQDVTDFAYVHRPARPFPQCGDPGGLRARSVAVLER